MENSRRSIFRDSALMSGLLTVEQVDEVERAVRVQLTAEQSGKPAITDDVMAEKTVELQLLTAYQADQLKAGRTKLHLKDYVIIDFIGQGGSGQVFKAEHILMGRVVAVKVLPVSKSTPQAIDNFSREIRLQANLDHPNLVRADYAGHDGNVYFLVTEYVPGTDLRRLVRHQGPLAEMNAASVIRQAALGLHYAHQRNLIHRDVKPGNILVTPEGITKVSDLGLAGFVDQPDADPRAGKIVGTADYLAPDIIRSPRDVTAASDIYSLGCALYYAATGKVPFPGGQTRDKIRRHCEEVPWHPRRLNPELSEEFVEVIADMMEKDPALRVQTAEEVAARLEPWASEVAPVVSQPTKSPWLPPPLPTGDDMHDTAEFGDSPNTDTPSQLSQSTDALAAAGQETGIIQRESYPKNLGRKSARTTRSITFALAIAVPLSMLAGALVALALSGQI